MNGKIVLVGEPMGLFVAEEEGELGYVEKFSASVAGAEYNVAVGLTRLGHKVAYCTKLGFDPMADRILAGMEKNKISTELVMRTKDYMTGFMLKGKTNAGDPKIAYFRKNSAASTLCPHDMDKLDLFECSHMHFTGITPAISDTAMAAIKRLIKRVKTLDMTVSFDPNLRPQLWKNEKTMISAMNSLAESADTVLPGISEGKLLTGHESPEGIAHFYHNMGVANVIVKLGAKGAYYSGPEGVGYADGFTVKKIVDTVGAGDGFAAGVISAMNEGLSLKEAAERGNVIGAVQLTSKSDNEALPTKRRLQNIMARGYV